MLFIRYLLLILIYEPTNNANHNDLSFLNNQRIKRFFSRKSSKSKIHQEEDILLNNHRKTSKKESNKGYTQQDLAEINRILSKKENDYYAILGINNQATREKILNAYKKLTLRVHPDKVNAPGATAATQRLNKARFELLKKFEYSKQKNTQQTTTMFASRSFTSKENQHREVIDESDLISTFSPLPSEPENEPSKNTSFSQKSNYILLASVLFIIGILILIIYCIQRQRRLSSSTGRNISNNPPTYETPERDNDKVEHRDSEVSVLEDEE